MRFQVFFKHMDASQAVQDYAAGKLRERFAKYSLPIGEVHLTFSIENIDAAASCYFVADGHPVHLIEVADSMNAAVDGLVDRVDMSLRRLKEKRCSHRVRRDFPLAEPAEVSLPEDNYMAASVW
jgi:ribosomal subunit interface protein